MTRLNPALRYPTVVFKHVDPGRRHLVTKYADGWPDEPIYPADRPARLLEGDEVRDPVSGRSLRIPCAGYWTFFELMCMIHGASDAGT